MDIKEDLLKRDVLFLFKSAGFDTKIDIKIAGYPTQILTKIGNRKVIVECKCLHHTAIKNLIYEWGAKNKLIHAGKIIIVIDGPKIKQKDKELASRMNIELWGIDDLVELFALNPKQDALRRMLLSKIALKPISVAELYQDQIKGSIAKHLLSQNPRDDKFELLNSIFRAHIMEELRIKDTNKQERFNHHEIFENTRKKKGIFQKQRSTAAYWKELSRRLVNEQILPKETQASYELLMKELEEEYDTEMEQSEDAEKKTRKLIQTRLYDALINNEICIFGFKNNTVKVTPAQEGEFILSIDGIDQTQIAQLDWILEMENSKVGKSCTWRCLSIDEASEKTYRILEEFYGYMGNEDLRDYGIKN